MFFTKRIPLKWGLSIFGVEIVSNNDIIDPRSPTAQKLAEEAKRARANETGWDRLKQIFVTDEFGAVSPELDSAMAAASTGLVFGLFLGGIPASKAEYNNFIDRNKASQFESHFEAKTKLQHSVTKAMAVNGWRVGWRLGLFTGAYVFFTSAVSTYRNKSTVFEYSVGGLLAGAMYKLPMGGKAMVAGGVGGAALGTVAGAISVGIMKLTGTTTEEVRYWRRDWKERINSGMRSMENPRRAQEMGTMAIAHELGLLQNSAKESTQPSQEEQPAPSPSDVKEDAANSDQK